MPPDLPKDRLIAEVSMWSADLLNLDRDLDRIAPYADMLHLDVADARFTPDFLFFPDLAARIADKAQCPVHVHLMAKADIVVAQARRFADTGAQLLTVHVETGSAGQEALRAAGCAGGAALLLDTPLKDVLPFLDHITMVTLMGTRIGIKGAGLDPRAPERIRQMRALLNEHGRADILVAADGGIRESTVGTLRSAGADSVVLGSLAFGAEDLAERFTWLHGVGTDG